MRRSVRDAQQLNSISVDTQRLTVYSAMLKGPVAGRRTLLMRIMIICRVASYLAKVGLNKGRSLVCRCSSAQRSVRTKTAYFVCLPKYLASPEDSSGDVQPNDGSTTDVKRHFHITCGSPAVRHFNLRIWEFASDSVAASSSRLRSYHSRELLLTYLLLTPLSSCCDLDLQRLHCSQ